MGKFETNLKNKVSVSEKSYGSDTVTKIKTWFRFLILQPDFGYLPIIIMHYVYLQNTIFLAKNLTNFDPPK